MSNESTPNPKDLCIDHDRAARTGFSEVIYGLSKTPDQIDRAVAEMADSPLGVLATRVHPEGGAELLRKYPSGQWHEDAGVFSLPPVASPASGGRILVACAGTSDRPVAEETRLSAEFFGASVERAYDVGGAGLHRILAQQEAMEDADVVVVVAGMDGALPSVVGGLVSSVVIAVPTSVGYGSSFEGLAALLTMLNACAPGVVVTNIDNGFGAAVAAVRIGRLAAQARASELQPGKLSS